MKAFVTGASGFVGHAVCAELRSAGHEVKAFVRRPGTEPEGTEPVKGDMLDGDSIERALEQHRPECVIHLAAEIATQRDPVKIEQVNVQGTRLLLDAAVATLVRRFVFVSTVVTGDAQGRLLGERSALPYETAYGRSKQIGEQLVRDSGVPAVILRPSHVYGPGGWYEEEIVKRLRQPGRFAIVGPGKNLWDVVRVEDVATACLLAADKAPRGELYHVVDDEPVLYRDFVGLTAEALGVGPPRSVPAFLARRVAGEDPVKAVMRSARSSNTHIKRDLGWEPRYPSARQGVPDAVAKLSA
jgi:nucleoside-diphosphate-sugar epimerase